MNIRILKAIEYTAQEVEALKKRPIADMVFIEKTNTGYSVKEQYFARDSKANICKGGRETMTDIESLENYIVIPSFIGNIYIEDGQEEPLTMLSEEDLKRIRAKLGEETAFCINEIKGGDIPKVKTISITPIKERTLHYGNYEVI